MIHIRENYFNDNSGRDQPQAPFKQSYAQIAAQLPPVLCAPVITEKKPTTLSVHHVYTQTVPQTANKLSEASSPFSPSRIIPGRPLIKPEHYPFLRRNPIAAKEAKHAPAKKKKTGAKVHVAKQSDIQQVPVQLLPIAGETSAGFMNSSYYFFRNIAEKLCGKRPEVVAPCYNRHSR